MNLDENSFVCSVLGTKRIWEPIKIELKDKVTGVAFESENTWVFLLENNLVAVESVVSENFIPTIENLGVK